MSLKLVASTSDEEKHEYDVTSLIYKSSKVYSAADDGKIKMWSADLKLLKEIRAHPCSIYSLTCDDGNLIYSCSSDGSVRSWDADTLQEVKCIKDCGDQEIWKCYWGDGVLAVVDDQGVGMRDSKNSNSDSNAACQQQTLSTGRKKITRAYEGSRSALASALDSNPSGFRKKIRSDTFPTNLVRQVTLYDKEGKQGTIVEMMEQVKDIAYKDRFLFTVRDLDLVVTEILPGEKNKYTCRCTINARAPLALVGDKLVSSSRDGKDISINYRKDNRFEMVTQIKDAHNLIINTLSGGVRGSEIFIYSAGWDKNVKQWRLVDGGASAAGVVDVEGYVNALCVAEACKSVYAGGANGKVWKIDTQ